MTLAHFISLAEVEDLLVLWRADFLGGKQVKEETLNRFVWIQEQIRKASVFLSVRNKQLNWVVFGEFAHEKGLVKEKSGLFKEQVRRQVMLDTSLSLNDPHFLEQEYNFFLRSSNSLAAKRD